MNIQEKIIEVNKLLNEIDNYSDSLPNMLSVCDSKIDDLEHLIEFNKLNTAQCYRVIKELRSIRNERRRIKDDMELIRIYKQEQNKLLGVEHRPFLLSNIGKTVKIQSGRKYSYKAYTKEEINELIGV